MTSRPSANDTDELIPFSSCGCDVGGHDVTAVPSHLDATALDELGGWDAVVPEQSVDTIGRKVAGRTTIQHHDRPPRPSQHQRPVQPGGSAPDHDNVIRGGQFVAHDARRTLNGGYWSVSNPTYAWTRSP